MSVGITLTYMTTKVPDFAHGTFVTIGAYVSYTGTQFVGISVYESAIIAMFVGGGTALAMYIVLLSPLIRRNSSYISMMIATFLVAVLFNGILGIYIDSISSIFRTGSAVYFLLGNLDFHLFGQVGVATVAPIVLVIITASLYFFLTRTRFGIAMRATVENPDLASDIGIDVSKVYMIAWFLAGGFAGVAGSLLVLWLPGSINTGQDQIVYMFAGSILGGLSSIYGAILGGVLVGAAIVWLPPLLAPLVGLWIYSYQIAIAAMMLGVVLILFPNGLVSIRLRRR
jgi:branched-chain amino acid transport system permease protein